MNYCIKILKSMAKIDNNGKCVYCGSNSFDTKQTVFKDFDGDFDDDCILTYCNTCKMTLSLDLI
jgi:hypothetical protein